MQTKNLNIARLFRPQSQKEKVEKDEQLTVKNKMIAPFCKCRSLEKVVNQYD